MLMRGYSIVSRALQLVCKKKCKQVGGYSIVIMTNLGMRKSSRLDVGEACGPCGQFSTAFRGLYLGTISIGNATNEGFKARTVEHCN
jgi:hypothetical protein